VADCDNHRIQIFKSEEQNGAMIHISEQNNKLNCPTDVVLDHDLNLYVANNGNHRIFRFMSNSNESHCLVGCADSSGNGPDRLKNPISISFDSHGGIYVTDSNNHRVQKFSLATNSCGKKRIFSCRTNNYS
jgi:DNA-binding beta-propeller fold protein YncE